jgi:hypothetical protein
MVRPRGGALRGPAAIPLAACIAIALIAAGIALAWQLSARPPAELTTARVSRAAGMRRNAGLPLRAARAARGAAGKVGDLKLRSLAAAANH